MSDDLFASETRTGTDYDVHSIDVFEGLEPVRRRTSMYVGGGRLGDRYVDRTR